mmetsp:Transcript_26089/g.45507  ORF Transcript_26089/g.45507 Transcript_26089/m.45507 type:complete len:360 (-) Transcript_26089:287-1366(-)
MAPREEHIGTLPKIPLDAENQEENGDAENQGENGPVKQNTGYIDIDSGEEQRSRLAKKLWRSVVLSNLGKGWQRGGSVATFICIITLPFLFYSWKDVVGVWYMPLLGLAAAPLPSGGAPIAGGIIFFPFLTEIGVGANQAVAFSAATQMIGCGILTPLNWIVEDKSVFIWNIIPITLVPGSLGCFCALFLLPLSNEAVELFFAFFCLVLGFYVIHGLRNTLVTNNEAVELTSKKVRALYVTVSFIGGLVTGWIGIGIEKALFVLLTSYPHKAEIRRACITSISVVGWISLASTLAHALGPGDLPYLLWLAGLPGVFLGSRLGPALNRTLGPRNIMLVFSALLFVDAARKFQKSYHHYLA